MLALSWQWPHVVKGALTWVPPLDAWRRRHVSTGGTSSARYCYSVWLRHLVKLQRYGFQIKDARIAELGPGDTIGTGLAALLSGANQYIGLDVLPLSTAINLNSLFEALVQFFERKEPIPDDNEFPRVRPKLLSYEFPESLIDWTDFRRRVESLRGEIRAGLSHGTMIRYRAPWTLAADIPPHSLDLVFSQAVLEYTEPLNDIYCAMSLWLKAGHLASHVVDFSAHGLSPFWNGHWAYSDAQWRLVRGRREIFLNRQPVSAHVACVKDCGFEILLLEKDRRLDGLNQSQLSPPFQALDIEDVQTRGVTMILRKNGDA
jgi:hypothetical protein